MYILNGRKTFVGSASNCMNQNPLYSHYKKYFISIPKVPQPPCQFAIYVCITFGKNGSISRLFRIRLGFLNFFTKYEWNYFIVVESRRNKKIQVRNRAYLKHKPWIQRNVTGYVLRPQDSNTQRYVEHSFIHSTECENFYIATSPMLNFIFHY